MMKLTATADGDGLRSSGPFMLVGISWTLLASTYGHDA